MPFDKFAPILKFVSVNRRKSAQICRRSANCANYGPKGPFKLAQKLAHVGEIGAKIGAKIGARLAQTVMRAEHTLTTAEHSIRTARQGVAPGASKDKPVNTLVSISHKPAWRTVPEILAALSETADRTTQEIAHRIGIRGPQDAAVLRKYLLRLAKAGLVERSQFMACKSAQWRRTAAGTATVGR
jgi:hypothetical protein